LHAKPQPVAQLWEFRAAVQAKVHASADFSPTELGPLATALEGRQVDGGFRRWVARVHGVHQDDRAWWIQVAEEGDEAACVVLRCSHRATADQAAAVLRQWQPSRTLSLLVLNVMAVA
jgi:hypothetical protein